MIVLVKIIRLVPPFPHAGSSRRRWFGFLCSTRFGESLGSFCSSFFFQLSSYFVLLSSFVVLRSSFFVLRPSFFVLRSSFFVLRPSFFLLLISTNKGTKGTTATTGTTGYTVLLQL